MQFLCLPINLGVQNDSLYISISLLFPVFLKSEKNKKEKKIRNKSFFCNYIIVLLSNAPSYAYSVSYIPGSILFIFHSDCYILPNATSSNVQVVPLQTSMHTDILRNWASKAHARLIAFTNIKECKNIKKKEKECRKRITRNLCNQSFRNSESAHLSFSSVFTQSNSCLFTIILAYKRSPYRLRRF